MSELNEQKKIQLAISAKCQGTVLFRNNTGSAWQGDVTRNSDGSITIRNPRPLAAGLCKGGADLVGWTSVEITPEMVGKKMAVWTAIEVKTSKGKVSAEQANFIRVSNHYGGIAGVARTPEEGVEIIQKAWQ